MDYKISEVDPAGMEDPEIDDEVNDLCLQQNLIEMGLVGKNQFWYELNHRKIKLINERSERKRQREKDWNEQLVAAEKTQADSSKTIKGLTWVMAGSMVLTAFFTLIELLSKD